MPTHSLPRSPSPSPSKAVTIDVHHGAALLPRFFASVARGQECTERQPILENERLEWREHTFRFGQRAGRRMIVPAGSVPRIARELKARGFDVNIDDRRQWNRTTVDCSVCTATNHCSIEHAVAANHSGIFLSPSLGQMMQQMLEVINSLGSISIAVLTPTTGRQNALYRTVVRHMPAGILRPRIDTSLFRVWISTFETACLHQQNFVDAVVVPECELANSKRFADFIKLMRYRLFGLRLNQMELSAHDQLALETAFGDTILGMPSELPMVTFAGMRSPPSAECEDPVAWKRQAIWANAARNREIANIAGAVAGDPNSASHISPMILQRLDDRAGGQRRVCVLVEGLDHARQLASLLPAWSVVDRSLVQGHWMSLFAALSKARERGRGCIVTYSAFDASKVNLGNVLIRADAGLGGLNPDRPVCPKVVVDLVDLRSSQLAARFRKRLDAYHLDGLEIDERARARLRFDQSAGHRV